MKAHITVQSLINETPRVQQIRGIFDLAPSTESRLEWNVELPIDNQTWNVGLIVGPSGCGKSTVARHLWPSVIETTHPWSNENAILDSFPDDLPIKEIVAILSSVGFS